MRGVQIFSGNSHPALTEAICERLGTSPAKVEVKKFSNGETCVNIGVSIRNQDVFILQSGSPHINDSVIELLIMISACKGGSARSITAVMPYFPYSRQSKKKSHRGAITARMLANLLSVAGVDHVITVDLHASQMQGFFGQPVDNLFAEPLFARWIKANVPKWKDSVVVSKNAGGSKRVTSLADTLKLSFGIITTDRRRTNPTPNMYDSALFFDSLQRRSTGSHNTSDDADADSDLSSGHDVGKDISHRAGNFQNGAGRGAHTHNHQHHSQSVASSPRTRTSGMETNSTQPDSNRVSRVSTGPSGSRPSEIHPAEDYVDERAREVITSRLIQGHVVDDDHPSPALSAMSASVATMPGDRQAYEAIDQPAFDPMTSSLVSTVSSFQPEHALGGTFDATATSDEEEEGLKNPELEHTITLVGHVKDKTVFLVDDIIDRSGSWIAAAETVVKRGGAKQVYCIATHGLFGDDALEDMEQCDCIDYVVVTNSFPIATDSFGPSKKLIVLDLSHLLSEAIRRNHHGGQLSCTKDVTRLLTQNRKYLCAFSAS
ncbi:MAG: hypothetical protein Q9227_001585 [Pyrenula ochraceoflavens]